MNISLLIKLINYLTTCCLPSLLVEERFPDPFHGGPHCDLGGACRRWMGTGNMWETVIVFRIFIVCKQENVMKN